MGLYSAAVESLPRDFPADAGFLCHKSAVVGASIKETPYLWRFGLCLVIIQFAVNHNFMSASLTVVQVWHLAEPAIADIVYTGRLIN
jgi:hypothetical protein